MTEINMVFDGFWREPNKAWVTSCAGIYCVYACTYLPDIQKVHLDRLLYVGQSENVNDRIASHEKTPCWQACLQPSQELCYSIAEVRSSHIRDICEAALIYIAHPCCNELLTCHYGQESAKFALSGKIGLLPADFMVSRP